MGYHKKQQPETVSFDSFMGRTPPQALPLEEAVLGALMLDREALSVIDDILTTGDFYSLQNQLVFEAIRALADRHEPVDLLTVTEELKRTGKLKDAGGGLRLVELTNTVASAANIEYHARIVKQAAIKRRLIEAGATAVQYGFDDTTDPFEAVDRSEAAMNGVLGGAFSAKTVRVDQIAVNVLNAAVSASQKPGGLIGVPSGLKALDQLTGGWQDTDLIILAARPGMGKTSFALSCAINAAKTGYPAAFFTLEMGGDQVVQRALSTHTRINLPNLRTGKLTERDWQDLKISVESFTGMPLFIDDTPALTLAQLRSKARKMVSREKVKVIFLDYLQLMSMPNTGTRDESVGITTRGLKALAKELRVPIIALSQLSRAVEMRGGAKRPQLSDLRESGNIEQDADIVAFLYRPEYYGISEDENGASLVGITEVIIAKHRNGPVDLAKVGFEARTTRFYNLDEVQYSTPHTEPKTPEFNPAAIPGSDRRDVDIPF